MSIKGDTPEECDADRIPNKTGREGAGEFPNLPCEIVCSTFYSNSMLIFWSFDLNVFGE